MKTIKFGEVPTFSIKNKSIIGLDIIGYIAHTTVNTPFAADVLVLENILCNAKLIRKGKTTTIFNDNLRTLFAHSVYGRALWRAMSSQDLMARIQLAAAGAVKEIGLFPFVILLPSVINLKGDDELQITINLPVSAAAATVDQTVSYVAVDGIEHVGVEYGIPQIQSYGVQAAQPSESFSLGDGVVDCKFLNFDKESYLLANRVVTNLQMTSDKFQRNDSDLELQLKSLLGDQIPSATFEPYQSVQVYSGLELNDVTVELQLNSANVTASKNVVVWSNILTNPASVAKGNSMASKHNKRNTNRLFARS